MLEELDVREFAVAEHLHLSFAPGFTAITGETGAGKSLVIDALDVLLGGRPDGDVVRSGARSARIEGVFSISAENETLQSILDEAGIEAEDGLLVVSRELPRAGRSVARINGHVVVQSTLAAIGGRLVDIHSQTEHLAILKPSEHVNYLDRFAGAGGLRASVAELVAEVRSVRGEIERLHLDEHERARRQERLLYEVQEIEAARLQAEEEGELRRERSRLANAEQLAQLAARAYAALEGEEGSPGATDALGEAAGLAEQLARLDESLSAEATQLEALQSQAADLARDLRAYRDEIEFSPDRLQQVEDRLEALSSLKRKYGATIEEVLAYAAGAARELAELGAGEEHVTELGAREALLLERLSASAIELSQKRRAAAGRLSSAIEQELADLGLARGRFAVSFVLHLDEAGIAVSLPVEETIGAEPETDHDDGQRRVAFDRTGVDRLEFLVTLNPGEPLRPLARVASGGETSRLMLALKTILGSADAVPTLVFDEVEVGVGGRSGRVVGEKLAGLADHHQVITITHLPQIASLATRHMLITKTIKDERTVVTARELTGDERLEEIAAMLGGATAGTRASARELLEKFP